MFDRRLVEYFDWILLGITFLLCCIGLMTLYSAAAAGTMQKTLYMKQSIWFCAGLMLMVCSFLFNYRSLEGWSVAIYGGCILLLVCVLIFGKYIGGSRRWLTFSGISIQPSEMVKIALIVVLSKHYSRFSKEQGFTIRDLFKPFMLVAIPFFLVARQPDLGTAMLLLLIAVSMTVFVKIEKRLFVYLVSFCTITVPLVWFFLKDYQKERILTFLNPDRDPLGSGYHIIQSKIAIGSGMLSGKGFLKGTQNVFSFLPEQHTDFIFSVFAEEWGFLGSVFLIFMFLMLIVWGLKIANGCRDSFGTILAVGLTAMLFWEIFINVGMVTGLVPVVGVPLPFISYGGSSVVTKMIGIGLLLNLSMRRFIVE